MPNLIPLDDDYRYLPDRSEVRAHQKLRARSRYTSARFESVADEQGLKIDVLEYVGQKGQNAVTRVTRTEETCATMAPAASGRLALIADSVALAIAGVVQDTARRLR